MARYLYLGLFIFFSAQLVAQGPDHTGTGEGIAVSETDSIGLSLADTTAAPTKRRGNKTVANLDGDTVVPQIPHEVIKQRILSLDLPIDVQYNNDVARFVDMYTMNRRAQMASMLARASHYMPIFEEALKRHGIPEGMKYLPIIESALNPNAVSRVGATGLWQFMYGTAKMYDVEVSSYIDERRDPHLASDAAARFMRDLYDRYGDWTLVLAAYNCGPGNVNRAIRRSGKKTYWEIRNYLPRETRSYVPIFISAVYTFHYHEDHKIYPLEPHFYRTKVDTIQVVKSTSLHRVAGFGGISEEEIRFLNPSIRQGTIPSASVDKPVVVYVPGEAKSRLVVRRDSLYAAGIASPAPVQTKKDFTYSTTERNTSSPRVASTSGSSSSATPSAPSTAGMTKLTYVVKPGDNLGYIAEWYDCGVSDIQRWNGLSSTRIYAQQALKIYVDKGLVTKYQNVNSMSFAQKQKLEGKSVPKPAVSVAKNSHSSGNKNYTSYTVKNGDTLWEIVQRYPKNTVESVKQLNGITNSRNIKVGMVIKLVL